MRLSRFAMVMGICFASALNGRSPAAAITVFALPISGDSLVRFDNATPEDTTTIPVTGLIAGDFLVGIDFRPRTGVLYGVSSNDANLIRTYTIDAATGVATPVGSAMVVSTAGATAWGMDFNPTVDRIRMINNLASDGNNAGNANNFRLNPDTGALVTIDPDLIYGGLPGGVGDAPEVAVAYTNNFHNIGGPTTLHGIVSGGDQLVINGAPAPGFPTLESVGSLGVNTSNNAALDIIEPDNMAFAIMEVGTALTVGVSQFFTVDLSSGAVTLVGTIGDGNEDFQSMAVSLTGFPVASPVLSQLGLVLLAGSLAALATAILRRRGRTAAH